MSLVAIIAAETVAATSNDGAATLWVAGLIGIGGALPGLIAAISLFATRREVQQLEQRVDRTEAAITDLRTDVHSMEGRLSAAGEKRAADLHERINEVLAAVAEMRGELKHIGRGHSPQ